MIRVLVVDEYQLYRVGVVEVLAACPDIDVVADTDLRDDAVALARHVDPDVAVIGAESPGDHGIRIAHQLTTTSRTRVITLTEHDSGPLLLSALEAGAIGYLHRDIRPDALAHAIRSACRGEHRTITESLHHADRHILQELSTGKTDRQIARSLGLKTKTVTHALSRPAPHTGSETATSSSPGPGAPISSTDDGAEPPPHGRQA